MRKKIEREWVREETTTKARKFQNGNEQSQQQKNNDWNFDNKTTKSKRYFVELWRFDFVWCDVMWCDVI